MAELKVGNRAPNFELRDQNAKTVKLADYKGRKLLVYFYPKADTPGCTAQACAVSEALGALKAVGAAAIGISSDGPEAQHRFDQKYTLGFPLLCDTDHVVADAYGVWGQKSMYGKTSMGMIRSAFLIDEEGILLGVWYKVRPQDTVPAVQAVLDEKA